jgi:hypothetical protein
MQGQLVHIGSRRRLEDRPHARGRRDLVDAPDDGQDRAIDVGERHQPVLDREAALEHPVVGDELTYEVRHRGSGPGDPSLAFEEAALALAGQQRLTVVQLKQELDLVPQRLDGVEQLEAVAARPGGKSPSAQRVGKQLGGACGELLRKPERHRLPRVDRTAERDQRSQAVVAAVGGRLVTEHAALRVTGEVHVVTGRIADPVDGVRHRQHVVSQRPFQTPHFALGRAEVDNPGVRTVVAQDRHRARARGNVVDLGGEHQRRHQQDRGTDTVLVWVVVTQAVHALLRNQLVWRRLLVGRQPTEARHFERVLSGGSDTGHGSDDGPL